MENHNFSWENSLEISIFNSYLCMFTRRKVLKFQRCPFFQFFWKIFLEDLVEKQYISIYRCFFSWRRKMWFCYCSNCPSKLNTSVHPGFIGGFPHDHVSFQARPQPREPFLGAAVEEAPRGLNWLLQDLGHLNCNTVYYTLGVWGCINTVYSN